jgi:hypothetical protein
MIIDSPKVVTIVSADWRSVGRMTSRSITAPRSRPSKGTTTSANQNDPVPTAITSPPTVPSMKKSPCATLMTSSRPKMIESPRAMRAMISPQTSPFTASARTISLT